MKKSIFLLLVVSNIILAQDAPQFIYLDDPVYEFFDYAINSGRLNPDFAFQQPYSQNTLNDVQLKSRVAKYFQSYWNAYYSDQNISGQLQVSSRLNKHDKIFNRYRAAGSLHFNGPYLSVANRTIIDQDYKVDPLYAGDLSESDSWLFGRVNDAYGHFNFKNLDLFYGRMHRNWGPVQSPSLILSANPYTYDHFLFSYTYKKLKLSIIFARLEDLDALVKTQVDSSAELIRGARKFMVGHRLDLAFSDNFQIAFTEMAMYGGAGQDFELRFLNPLNFYYGLQRNDGLSISGLWNLDIFYKPHPQITLYLQGLIDDVIVNNDPGVDDRARYPDRLGITASARTGDLLIQGLNTDLTYTRIWNRTYQSLRTYENYNYRGLGLGYPCASCEEFTLRLSYWDMFPFVITSKTIIGRYGSVALTDLFPLKKEPFPIGPITNNIINITELHYFPSTWLQSYLRIHYSKEPTHYLSRINPYEGVAVSIGIKLILTSSITL